jgi:hypothetical protein
VGFTFLIYFSQQVCQPNDQRMYIEVKIMQDIILSKVLLGHWRRGAFMVHWQVTAINEYSLFVGEVQYHNYLATDHNLGSIGIHRSYSSWVLDETLGVI